MLVIRNATIDDLESITKIYNYAILNTVATFDTEIKTVEDQIQWFKGHSKNNPIIVAEEKGSVIGWAALSKYSTRCAYSNTAEISLYVGEKPLLLIGNKIDLDDKRKVEDNEGHL